MVEQLEISSGASEELKDKIETVDENKMADAELALGSATEEFELEEVELVALIRR